MEQFEPFVGARVVVAREPATVRYIGQVAKQQGIWIGLEWDDPSRGKHDGTTGGIKYFSCESGQNAGSFVRAEKVNYGAGLAKALVARYTNECAEGYDVARPDDMVIKTASNKPMQVNMVGEEKVKQRQSKLQLLTHARIVKAYVSHLVRNLEPLPSCHVVQVQPCTSTRPHLRAHAATFASSFY
jgi:dynactin complex subunit